MDDTTNPIERSTTMTQREAKSGDRVLEITERDTGKVVLQSIVTGMPQRQIERLERGMLINLNHADFYVNDRVIS